MIEIQNFSEWHEGCNIQPKKGKRNCVKKISDFFSFLQISEQKLLEIARAAWKFGEGGLMPQGQLVTCTGTTLLTIQDHCFQTLTF